MTSGTKVVLALITLFVGVLVLYYGVLMPSGGLGEATGGGVRDPALEVSTDDPAAAPPIEAVTSSVTGAAMIGTNGDESLVPTRTLARPEDRLPAAVSTATTDAATGLTSGLTGRLTEGRTADPLVATRNGTIHRDAPAPDRTRLKEIAMGGPVATIAPATEAPITAHPTRTPVAQMAASLASRSTPGRYVVRPGDTLTSIAQAWFGDHRRWDLIAQMNDVDPNRLQVGQELRLPPRNARRPESRMSTEARATTYTVRSGDTLSSISKRFYGSTAAWKTIYVANRDALNRDPHALRVGQKLRIPAARL